jgi:hypothetical protein
MKTIAILAAVALSSCTWKEADFQRLGTKVLDSTLNAAANEAQAIQIEKQSGK